ncbi:MAG: hypothetical protein Kow0059_00550 [Candidatus Sumerlaeia bacterium]
MNPHLRTAIIVITVGVVLLQGADGVRAATSARALVNEGMALFKEQRYDEALEKFQQAKEADPDFHEIDLNIANALLKSGRFKEAEEAYGRLLQTPEGKKYQATADYNRGVAYYNQAAGVLPDPTLEGLMRQGLLQAQPGPDGQTSFQLKPEAQQLLRQALQDYDKSRNFSRQAIPLLEDDRQARANFELASRQYLKTKKLLEMLQPPERQQQKNQQDQNKQQDQQQQQDRNDQPQDQRQPEDKEQDQKKDQTTGEDQQPQQQDQQPQPQGQQPSPTPTPAQSSQPQQADAQPSEGTGQKEDQPQGESARQEDTPQNGMQPQDALALLNTLNDQPREEQLKEMLRYQMRGMKSLDPDW